MTTRLERLCDALRDAGAIITVESRTALRVKGARVAALAGEITYFKPELLRGLYGTRNAEPYACGRCGAEVVLTEGERCLWCAESVPAELTICPNSPAEVAYLQRCFHSEKASHLSQRPVLGHLGQNTKIHPTRKDAAA